MLFTILYIHHVISYRHIAILVASCHIMSYCIKPYYPNAMSCHITSCHTIPCRVRSHHVMFSHIITDRVISYQILPCHVISYHIIAQQGLAWQPSPAQLAWQNSVNIG